MSFLAKLNRRAALALLVCASVLGMNVTASPARDKSAVTLGVMEGPEGEIWRVAVQEAKKEGLDIKLVYFSDFSIPNEALNAGDLDANAFQHKPYLDAQVKQRGYKLSIAGYSTMFPMGAYSRKIKDLSQLREGAEVGLPDDPSNRGRALHILAQYGVITLKDPDNILVTVYDIKDNPKKLKFREMDANIVGRAIDDLDVSIVNTVWIEAAGLDPDEERIAQEKAEGNPYNNIIVVRTEDLDKPWVKKLVQAYQNEAVRAEIKKQFGSDAITSW
ncbi:MAG: Lipoprotein [Candidatus Tokpelaia hoelldobleri]|uniref:Lipoprotein n=1 Tax=Candidatus Tokpelaia hoelldobleri TaxID=1902579 RepID=A0A1U9JT44_9HYPH|nr:MAG: Lipoprotein [Candidatus Tokpelaia hoelldoblerii]